MGSCSFEIPTVTKGMKNQSIRKNTVEPTIANSQTAPQSLTNPVKDRLKAGQPVIGVVISVNNIEVAAHAAGLGFDFLWIEMEHCPISLDGLRNMILATRGLPAVPFARPPVNELWTAKRVLDAGALGVIFPFTRTPELARQAVAACRYPPAGLRGSGADLANARWSAPEGYYDFADRNVLVIAVVEDTSALAHIDEIAATPGLDVLFIGTSDLSFSLGLRGDQDHPKLHEAIAQIVAAGKKHGKALGRPARTPQQIREYQAQGFLFFMTATDLDLMSVGAADLLAPLGRGRGWKPGAAL
jgi:2-keto-3-deoxy-L-rhamnonate aldolase RhmA